MELKDNFFRYILISLVVISTNRYICQSTDSIVLKHSFKEYKESIFAGFKFYNDSVTKRAGKRWIVIEVCISDFDTLAKKLKMSMDFSWYSPIPLFYNPTHIIEWKKRIYVIRFGKNVGIETIKRLNFQIITKKKIKDLERLDALKRGGVITMGESECLVFKINQNSISKKWYPAPMAVPVDDKIDDYDYTHGEIKYEVYLENKLKEYGYYK